MQHDRRITVAHVVGQLTMGGMEKLLVEFARHADRERFALHFLTLGDRGAVAKEIEALGWPVTSIEAGCGLNPWLVVRLARTFRRLGVDVVHTHNNRPLLYGGPAAVLARARRVIHTRHGQGFGASRRETVAARLAARTADRIVSVSHDSTRIARAEGYPPRRLQTLWNGIDVTRFRRADPDGAGPVLSVGRLSPEKDFSTLIRAAAIAAQRDPTFRIEIAGDGACAAELRRLVGELRLEGIVTLHGQVLDVPSLLARASVFTLPSLTEGVSLTVLEAMATGLPVVATRVGGNPEVVVNGETGLLVPPANAEALAAALIDLWSDPTRRRKMGAAGRARVESFFDVRQMVAAYETLYLEEGRSLLVSRSRVND